MYPQDRLREALRLYAVTDRSWLGQHTLSEQVGGALAGGATFVQLREKHLGPAEMSLFAQSLADLTRGAGVPLVINDDVGLAWRADADGVHVGQGDMACAAARALLGPEKIVGVSVASVAQAREAERQGADYLGVGAVFATATKPDAAAVGTEVLAAICAAVALPVVAIGGLNAETIPLLKGTGVAGAAVVSALFAAEDIERAARGLRARIDEAVSSST